MNEHEVETVDRGERLEKFRAYLNLLARVQMGGDVRRRHAPSDMVQLTLLQAHRAFQDFRGGTYAEMAAWLRRILARNLAHAYRDMHRAKRDAGVERSLEGALEGSSAKLGRLLASKETSPSQKVVRTEQLLRLAHAVERLPDARREAIVLHYWEELPIAEIAARLDRTSASIAGLLHRALKGLRAALEEDEG